MRRPLMVAGLEGAAAVGGLSAIGARLYSIGIPKDSILTYETALKTDNFLLVAHGIAEDVAKARDILRTTRALELELRAGEPPTRSATVQVGAEEV